jgi:acyl carrier protein
VDDENSVQPSLPLNGERMSDQIVAAVHAALGRQLKLNVEQICAKVTTSLDALGLDSHGLMRVLLDIERELKLPTSLDLPDEALESPQSLAAGVVAAVHGK